MHSDIMESDENIEDYNVSFVDGHLSFLGSEASCIPLHLAHDYAKCTRHLNLSYNLLSSLDLLDKFTNLEELILDNNQLSDDAVFPHLEKLHTLSINKNQITQLDTLIQKLATLPLLKYLSLHGNPVCPDQLSSSEKNADDYRRYRYALLYNLPHLKFLDSTPVGQGELKESRRVGPYLLSVAPIKDSSIDKSTRSQTNNYTPLPEFKSGTGKHNGTYGTCKYIYYGRHSEGNRFIRNKDL